MSTRPILSPPSPFRGHHPSLYAHAPSQHRFRVDELHVHIPDQHAPPPPRGKKPRCVSLHIPVYGMPPNYGKPTLAKTLCCNNVCMKRKRLNSNFACFEESTFRHGTPPLYKTVTTTAASDTTNVVPMYVSNTSFVKNKNNYSKYYTPYIGVDCLRPEL